MTDKRFYLDRIESDIAVLIPEGGQAERSVPRAQLPRGAREGVWLVLGEGGNDQFELDEAGTKTAKADVQNLMDELAG